MYNGNNAIPLFGVVFYRLSTLFSEAFIPLIMTAGTMNSSFIPYRKAGAYIASRLRQEGMEDPEVGIICGSGLKELSQALEGKTLTVSSCKRRNLCTYCSCTQSDSFALLQLQSTLSTLLQIQYSEIPCFPKGTTVAGHVGEVVIGQLSGVTTICFRGRFHCYEGHPVKRTVLPGKSLKKVGYTNNFFCFCTASRLTLQMCIDSPRHAMHQCQVGHDHQRGGSFESRF